MFYLSGTNAHVGSIDVTNLKKLPAKNWSVKRNPTNGEYYLSEENEFSLPKKIYGEPHNFVKKILNTFKNRPGNLGVLLRGLKGTGKSLTAKMLCIESGLPVISISDPFTGTDFLSFMSSIKQEVAVFVDEFEKVYTRENQAGLLTLLDGAFEGKKLYILTANESRFHSALMNRPGRIYYSRHYVGLEGNVVSDVIEDLLLNKDNSKDLVEVCSMIGDINLDSLITIIQEMNLYKETAREVIKDLNISPERSTTYEYQVKFDEYLNHEDSYIFGGGMKGTAENIYFNFTLEGFVTKHKLIQDYDSDTTSLEATKKLVDEAAVSTDGVWISERFDKGEYTITPLNSSKLKLTITDEISSYRGISFILNKISETTFVF